MTDFLGLMKQAAQLQTKMQALQAELDLIEVEGVAGGGLVTVKLTAKGDLRGTRIDDSLLKPSEKEILEDLLVAAHAEARSPPPPARVGPARPPPPPLPLLAPPSPSLSLPRKRGRGR